MKTTFRAESFIRRLSRLSLVISAQTAREMCVAATNRQKIHENLYSGVQGYSRSLFSVPIKSQCRTFYQWLIVTWPYLAPFL